MEREEEEIRQLERAADDCDKEEEWDKIKERIWQKLNTQARRRTRIQNLAIKNNLLCLSINKIWQYDFILNRRQTEQFLEEIENLGIILLDRSTSPDVLCILPPGSKEIAKLKMFIGASHSCSPYWKETRKIQLPTGKVVKFVSYQPSGTCAHLILQFSFLPLFFL